MRAANEGQGVLETCARQLAETHVLAERGQRGDRARVRLPDYAGWLVRFRAALVDPRPELAKAAEWLLDNEYLIARATRQVRDDLTREFEERLPALGGTLAGQLRIHSVANTLLVAARLQLSLASARQFIQAYQERAPLTIAELWAFPIFLRLHCLNALVAATVEIAPGLRPSFPLDDVEDIGLHPTERVGRAVSTLHAIAAIPWKDFFCQTSRVEAVFADDPAGVYAAMDFDTRDRYRKAVEEIARTSAYAEAEVADRVVRIARQWVGRSARRAHVGYWLIDAGRDELEQTLACRPSRRTRVERWAHRHALPLYFSALASATAAVLALPLWHLAAIGADPGAIGLALLLAALPATTLAITFVQWVVTNAIPPQTLPKIDFEAGVPKEHRTAVVVPTLVTNADDAVRQVEQLEIHYLANPAGTAQFVLLSDFVDAPAERQPGDDAIIEALGAEVRRLNTKYPSQPFHVLHRPRRFNPSEGVWMGWERKRGKIEQLNRLLSGLPVEPFLLHEGNPDGLSRVRYVVTLDADTMLPRTALARLIGTLAHPLNRPEFDDATGRVRAGYTIVQPRVEILPEVGSRSALARWFTGDTAIDIYSHAVSDVYQDLFGCGIYVGKGAYHLDAFRQSLEHRVPEHRLLSHDLFEGLHGRVGLATDILLYEQFPTHYVEFARRAHRWIRGDWQLLPWLGRRVPGPDGARLSNRFTLLDRWKILDNLRRSLLAPGLLAMLVAGWLVLPGHPLLWTLLACAAPGAHVFTDLVTGFARGRRRTAITAPFQRVTDQAGRWVLLLLFLPFDAAVAIDAIARTLVRLWTRRHLLEWVAAAHAAHTIAATDGRRFVWRAMIAAPLAALAIGVGLVCLRPDVLPIALPLLVLWLVAPEVAYRLGRPRREERQPLAAADRDLLRQIARRTWLYFETFAGPEDHWLPPDNYQEAPRGEVAHRTSPTNVGMMLVASVAAYDLGYVGALELATRARATLDTLDRLDRHKGHFFNWYHTRTLEPLLPRYVSTVDSGNLACSLVALKQTCLALADAPLLTPQRPAGIRDVALLLFDAVTRLPGSPPLRAHLDSLLVRLQAATAAPDEWPALARTLHDRELTELDALIRAELGATNPPPDIARVRAVRVSLERLHHDVRAAVRDEDALCPWLASLRHAPDSCRALAAQVAAQVSPATPLSRAARQCRAARDLAAAAAATAPSGDAAWMAALVAALERAEHAAASLCEDLSDVAARADALAMAMDFRWLYDRESRLLHLGYNVSADRIDPHHYDLLASEARLASLFAIAKGDIPVEHWFHLGRPIASIDGRRCLVSWGGSMFEYLMPSLFMRSEPGTLLAESERLAVDMHSRHARRRDIPWGMSESAFAATDADHIYQYQSFGVPDLRFRRGAADDAVIAPYATALAAMIAPAAALENFRRLQALGVTGEFGCYEAVDFTPERRPAGRPYAVVRCYMAHHQGMILAALDNTLCGDVLPRRVAADHRIRAVSLLLHERVPREAPPETMAVEMTTPPTAAAPRALAPWAPTRAGAFPEMLFLGNGRLASWISDSGSGVLRWREWTLTHWQPDAVRDDAGIWLYVRDDETGAVWSATRQPTGAPPDAVDVLFYPHLAEFHRRDGDLAVRLEVAVAAADDVELRRLTVINDGTRTRRITVTTCAEVALAEVQAHERHPAFSKLFVHSEPIPAVHGLLFERRPRSPGEHPPVLLHWLITDDPAVTPGTPESDRRAFVGRGRTSRDPAGLTQSTQGTTGFTLDPIMALRASIVVAPGRTVRCTFATAIAASRESVLDLAGRYQTMSAVEWAMTDAQNEVAREVGRLAIQPDAFPSIQQFGSLLLYPRPAVRAAESIAHNQLGQAALWGLGLSGDLPLLVVKVPALDESSPVDDLIAAVAFWKRRHLSCDLVVLHEGASGYEQPLARALRDQLHAIGWHDQLGVRGGVHLIHADRLEPRTRALVEAAAVVVLDMRRGSLTAHLDAVHAEPAPLPRFTPAGAPADATGDAPALERPQDLQFDNGFGGFSADGREYIIHLAEGDTTPAPWSNILANATFGSLVTEAGLGFTWCANSAEHRLTPWTNDPVSDGSGEAIYLRDEESAGVWSPTPQPAPGGGAHQIRHGMGYTSWRSRSHGLAQELTVFVPPDDPVKIARLRLHNHTARPRRLTVTYFAEWVLGPGRRPGALLAPEYDAKTGALLARNPWATEFAGRIAFLASDRRPHGLTANRAEFLGREQTPRRPAALERWGLSGQVQAGGDACAAVQVHVDLAPGADTEVVFLLGEGADRHEAAALVAKYRAPGAVDAAWTRLRGFWDGRLGAVEVETPDAAANLLLNRWLLYQVLASRLLARTGFYQSSGAIGFRDQLQDVLALVLVDPARCRAHLLECAVHQFAEGDVLHWWHPPSGRGVRTRCSDDLLWLPYAVGHYVVSTGDHAVLDESVPFLRGRLLAPHEDDLYAAFERSDDAASLFEHCERALERGVTRGPHGLPLIGAGDWNDGMNRVGRRGRGESVWLACFAACAAHQFVALCLARNDTERAERWTRRAREIEHAIEDTAWDGDWYCRAFDDEGRPWGSRTSEECQIDSLAQSWAVMSGAAPRDRAEQAMRAVAARLIDREHRLVRLLTPPFARTVRDPGYIKAYPPGVRENGGQYTHAAVWVGWAYTCLDDAAAALDIFALLNPIRHSSTRDAAEHYRVEPYVLAADVYDGVPYAGRGGWTWYTGSAAWLWRLGVERLIGLRLEGGALRIQPCLPASWPRVRVRLRTPGGALHISIEQSPDTSEVRMDGTLVPADHTIPVPTDGREHQLLIRWAGTAARSLQTAR